MFGHARLGRHLVGSRATTPRCSHRLLLSRMQITRATYATRFNGADSIFRGVLVPIFGLKAQLLRRDARVLAEETTKGLTEEQKAAVVASFNEGVSKKTN